MWKCAPYVRGVNEIAGRLAPVVEKYRDEADRMGRLPRELTAELREMGAFGLLTPREFGGPGMTLAEYHEILESLGRVDGAVAWTVWNLNMGLTAAYIPESGAALVFSGQDDPLVAHNGAPGQAEPVDGGFRLSGTWKLVSGAQTAEWFMLGALAGERMLFCLVPRDDVIVRMTWDVVAMRGSDSNTVEASDAVVPADRVFDLASPSRVGGALYRLPIVTLFAAGPAAVLIGMAQAAVEEASTVVRDRTGGDGAPLVAQPRVQAAIGRATVRVAAARTLLLNAAAELDAVAAIGGKVSEAQRGLYRGAICHIAEVAREVLVSMYDLGGSGPIFTGNRLGRLFADGMAAAQHMNVAPWQFEVVGRTQLGLPAGTPLL